MGLQGPTLASSSWAYKGGKKSSRAWLCYLLMTTIVVITRAGVATCCRFPSLQTGPPDTDSKNRERESERGERKAARGGRGRDFLESKKKKEVGERGRLALCRTERSGQKGRSRARGDGGRKEKQEGWKRKMGARREGWMRRMGGGDGRRDGRRNVTDGSCLARAGRERRGWQHRVREHTQTHTIHTATARVHACAPDNSSRARSLRCHGVFSMSLLVSRKCRHMMNRQIDGAADIFRHIVCINWCQFLRRWGKMSV